MLPVSVVRWWLLFAVLLIGPAVFADEIGPTSRRPRARQLGIQIGILPAGPGNAITDVAGVRVGHCTIIEGDSIRTGVTAVLPHADNLFRKKVPAAIVVGNGFGKLVGKTQVDELGTLESPIVLTNTLSTFAAADAVVAYQLKQPGNETVRSINPVVGETNDGYLNDIRRQYVRRKHVWKAIDGAQAGPVPEGSVGAGTGTRCFGMKGGIGTASRRLPRRAGGFALGVLVQSNFHGVLTVAGAPVGRHLGGYFLENLEPPQEPGGSCMIVLATDAPLDPRQLARVARRALLGLGAIGSPMSHGSGDYVIAFSTIRRGQSTAPVVPEPALSPLFQAAREATEEAILNSLLRATTVQGHRGRTVKAIDIARLKEICRKHGVLKEPVKPRRR